MYPLIERILKMRIGWRACLGLALGVIGSIVVIDSVQRHGKYEAAIKYTQSGRYMTAADGTILKPMAGDTMGYDTPFLVDGLSDPEIKIAGESPLGDEEEVIGVTVCGQVRAYAIRALAGMLTHVVNDFIDSSGCESKPVTVTYCDMTNCARVLTLKSEQKALRVGTGGWVGQELNITVDGKMYPQTSKDLPLDDLDFVRTTWGEWKALHPDTDVYDGVITRRSIDHEADTQSLDGPTL